MGVTEPGLPPITVRSGHGVEYEDFDPNDPSKKFVDGLSEWTRQELGAITARRAAEES